MSDNLYAPPKARVTDVTDGGFPPAIWNPNAAASWSFLFSPAVGALLQMKNWQALGQPDKAAAARTWGILSILVIMGFGIASLVLPEKNSIAGVSRAFGFVLLVSWYVHSGKPQVSWVKARFGNDYPRRGWTKPLLAAIAAVVGMVMFGVVAELVKRS